MVIKLLIHKTNVIVALLIAFGICDFLVAAEPVNTHTNHVASQNLPPMIKSLLEAQGKLESARFMAASLSAEQNKKLETIDNKAHSYIQRIYPACRALMSKSTENRVRATLYDDFRDDLASKIWPNYLPDNTELAPIYNDQIQHPNDEKTEYGEILLIDDNPLLWRMPAFWGKETQPPIFAGWKIKQNEISLTKNCSSLVRADFKIDDANVTGEVLLDEGECIFLILRSDIIIKFYTGEVRGSGGNLNVKFGYNNLRRSSIFSKVPEILPGQWYSFKIILKGERLQVFFDDKEAIDTLITNDPRIKRGKLAKSGYFGFGSNRGSGSFKNVLLSATSQAGKNNIPRLIPPDTYSARDDSINILESEEKNLISLSHGKTEVYKASRHKITNSVLFLKGAPYVQLSHKNIASEYFKVSGKIKFIENGSVWFRVNNRLLFGLCCGETENPFVIKHSTGNFHYVDEENPGEELRRNQWYTWELDYRNPAGTFRLDGNTIMISLSPTDRDIAKEGPNQFGISSYNTQAEISNLIVQKLAKGGSGDKTLFKMVSNLFQEGITRIEGIIHNVAINDAPNIRSACAILEGKMPPTVASSSEFIKLAETFRDHQNWPMYLSLLQANYMRFKKETPARCDAEKVWSDAENKYKSSIKKVDIGEIGLDNILRVGNRPGPIFSAGNAKDTWIFIPKIKKLLKYDPALKTLSAGISLDIDISRAIARKQYAMCLKTGDKTNIYKISLQTGKSLSVSNVTKRTILDFALQPKVTQTFLCVDENENKNMIDFGKYKIYVLNENTMQFSPTDAVGMFIAVDPLVRYLYSGFHVKLSRSTRIESSFLQIKPLNGCIDHLVRYRITPSGLIYDIQLAAPGTGGVGIATDPRGRQVCYLSSKGFLDSKNNEYKRFGIAVYKPTSITKLKGYYDSGTEPSGFEFNPLYPEAYVLAGNQIRLYNSETFELKSSITLPTTIKKKTITQFCAIPDGSGLFVGYTAKTGGVYIQHFGHTNAPPKIENIDDPLKMTDKAIKLIAENHVKQGSDILNVVADNYAFTPTGEEAAKTLLSFEKSLYNTDVPLFALPPDDVIDMENDFPVDEISIPSGKMPLNIGIHDPAYKDNKEFIEVIETLLSLKPLSDSFPASWFWKCHKTEKQFPKSSLLKLESALMFEKIKSPAAASVLAGELLNSDKTPDQYRFRASLLLARIYRTCGDKQRELTILKRAILINPQNATVNAILGDVYSTLKCPRRAKYRMLLSQYLFPSRPGLNEKLAQIGIITEKRTEPTTTSVIFREASPAVVLISHDGGNGTGFVISRNGLLLTNHHVIDGADKITVKFKGIDEETEHSVTATVIAADPLRDIALLSVDAEKLKVNPLILANSSDVRTGDQVIAIGNPGFGTRVLMNTATEGIVSGRNRTFGNRSFLQISAAVNPGNSGGPLLNRQGMVIGMVTLKAELENVGFAVPSSELLAFIEEHE